MKIGLFGGTFNPIHNGHLRVVEEAKHHLKLDRILLVPAGDPPHKAGDDITAKEDRLAMVRLAAGIIGAEVSEWELSQEEKSYSVLTLEHFREVYPDDELFFIIGADSFRDLPSWWHYRELLTLCTFVVISRPDIEKESLLSRYAGDEKPPRVFFLDHILMDISSTNIRQRVSEGKDISRLVPEAVLAYIQSHRLYQ